MSPSNERSAEWLRGAVESHINTCNLITSITSAEKSHPARQGLMAAGNELHNQLDRYRALLAAAEAREAGESITVNAGEVPDSWVKQRYIADHPTAAVKQALEKAHWIGCSPHEWPTVDDIPLLCRALIAEHERAASAAEVIAAAEKALEDCRHNVANHPDGHQKQFIRAEEAAESALAIIARWKEANGGK